MKNVMISLAMIVLLAACGRGPTGATGASGSNGSNGTNGSSCSVTAVPASSPAPNGGSLVACTDGTQNLLLNGTNGIERHEWFKWREWYQRNKWNSRCTDSVVSRCRDLSV
jgi:hypothetical protein